MNGENAMICDNCGNEIAVTDVVCENCHAFIMVENMIENGAGKKGGNTDQVKIENLALLIPNRGEKIVKCIKCGGQNRRGDSHCIHCGYLIIPINEHDEIVSNDDAILRKIDPQYHRLYFKIGCQLLVLKNARKIGKYPCSTKIEDGDGHLVKCDYPLEYSMKKCPRCGEPNDKTYACKNFDQGCITPIDIDDLRCPSCKASTMLSDMMNIISGKVSGDIVINYIDEHVDPIFPQFQITRQTLPITMNHREIIMMKFDLENISKRMAKILKWLAMYLEATTKQQGMASMPTIFQSFNAAAIAGSFRPPQRSNELNDLISEREQDIQNVAGAGDGNPPGNGEVENDNPGDVDDGFEFSVN
jgi:hypothetical protein